MPLPKPRGGKNPESKTSFISRCAGDEVSNKEFPDQKQKLAYCYSAWERRKAKASYIVNVGDEQYAYVVSTVILPDKAAQKVAALPQSGPGVWSASITYANGHVYAGAIKGDYADRFETDEDLDEEDPNTLTRVELNDTAHPVSIDLV